MLCQVKADVPGKLNYSSSASLIGVEYKTHRSILRTSIITKYEIIKKYEFFSLVHRHFWGCVEKKNPNLLKKVRSFEPYSRVPGCQVGRLSRGFGLRTDSGVDRLSGGKSNAISFS